MMSTVATPAKKSWAAIVKTGTVAELIPPTSIVASSKPPPLRPSPRGAKESLCHGRVLVMLGHYGWILPLDDIDYRDAAKNGGRIYIHKRDIMDDHELAEGDIVSFYLYFDEQGLGAEECCIESTSGMTTKPKAVTTMKATAAEFVPGAADGSSQHASAKMSGDVKDCEPNFKAAPFRMNPNAVEFAMNPNAVEFAPHRFSNSYCVAKPTNNYSNLLLINPAFLDDSDDESEEAVHIGKEHCHMKSVVAEKDCSSDHDLESDGSTSAGIVSDSDGECMSPPPGLGPKEFFSPPPGLSLPPGFRPPPGLC